MTTTTPPTTEYVYVDTAEGSVDHRNRVQRLADCAPSPKKVDYYATVLRFPEAFATHVRLTGSVKDYTGKALATEVWFDFDDEQDPGRALEDARRLITLLIEVYELDPRAIRIHFSGCKGFDVRIPSSVFGGFQPSEDINERIKRLATHFKKRLNLTTFDPAVYDKVRLLRWPNTRHGETLLHKIPLTVHEVLTLSIDQIRALAEEPRTVEHLPDDESLPRTELAALWRDTATGPEQRRRTRAANDAPPPIEPITAGCGWLRHCRDDAATLREPEWYAMLSIVGRCQDGDRLAHEWSEAHPDYTAGDTDKKLEHALTAAGPRTCAKVRDDLDGERFCSECPNWGRIKSPIVLADAYVGDAGDEPEREPAEPVEARSLDEVIETFQRWMHLPDPSALEVLLGTYAANCMAGDPVWTLLVAPPSGGKTALLQALTRLPHVHQAGTITEAGLLSGSAKKDHAKGAKGGLLHQIGAFGVLTVKDFTSIISLHKESRAQVLAALREVFDGSWTRHVGVDGGRELHWSGKVGLIGGVTPAIDTAHAVMAAMGERFLLFRSPKIDTDELADRALIQTGDEGDMREELAAAVAGLFAGLELPERPPALDIETRRRIVALASLAARARSHVERDPYRREIESVPEPEAPGRLAKALAGVYSGMAAIGVPEERRWHILAKLAADCLPAARRDVLRTLGDADGWMTTTQIAVAIRYPTVSARRAAEDLAAHGVLDRSAGGKGQPDKWRLTAWARARFDAIGTFSEKSDPIPGEGPERGREGEGSTPHTVAGDFSETPPEPGEWQAAGVDEFAEDDADGEHGRQTHCWKCGEDLSGAVDTSCEACGWIVCPQCGACGKGCGGAAEEGTEEADEPPPPRPTGPDVFGDLAAAGYPRVTLPNGDTIEGAVAWTAYLAELTPAERRIVVGELLKRRDGGP